MRLMHAAAGAAVISVVLAGGVHAQTTLTYSTFVPLNHPINTQLFLPWFEKVEKDSGGTLKIRALPKPVAAPNQHFDAIINGQVDIAFGVQSYQPDRFLPYLVSELPLLGNSAVSTSVALWRIHEKYLREMPTSKAVVLIGVMTHGPGQIHHISKAILKPADLEGQKIRVGGDVPKAIVRHFGGVVITQPATKSYEILSQGIADGIFFPFESVPSFNLTKVVTYTTYVDGGFYSSEFWFAMNKDVFAKLDKKAKDAIMKNGGENFARVGGSYWDRRNAEGLAKIKANKNTYVEAGPELTAKLKELTVRLEAEFAAKLDKLGFPGKQLIAEYRAEIAKIDAGK